MQAVVDFVDFGVSQDREAKATLVSSVGIGGIENDAFGDCFSQVHRGVAIVRLIKDADGRGDRRKGMP